MANLYLGSRKFIPAFYNTGSEPSPTPTPTPFVDSQYSTYSVVGQPTIEENIAKNFASDSFIFLPERFNPENNPWEIQLKVKTPNSISRRNLIFGSFRGYMSCGVGGELQSDHFGFGFSSSGNSWNIGWIWGTTTPELNTWYYIRLSFTGTQYKFELSTDGINWNLEGSINSSETIYSGIDERLQFGTHDCHFDYYTGEIDLSECYIRIITNPELLTWWKPHTKDGLKYAKVDNRTGVDNPKNSKMWLFQKANSYEVKQIFSNNDNPFTNNNEVTIINKIASNFYQNRFLIVNNTNIYFKKKWNMHFKIKTGNDVTTRQKLNGGNGSDYQYPTIEINSWTGDPRFCIHISSNASSWDIANGVMSNYIVLPNTTYWINFGWTGTVFYVNISLDGVNYFDIINIINSTEPFDNGNARMIIGNDHFSWQDDAYVPFLGEIDLNETCILYTSYFDDNSENSWKPYSTSNDLYNITNEWTYGFPIIDMPNNSYGIVRLYV